MANIQVTPAVNALLDADNSTQSKAALATLGVGTAGFVSTGITEGCVPILTTDGKLPAIDGSNLTGLSEVAELRPTTFILNELGNAIAPNNTLAYNGSFLSRHDGTIAGGKILISTESVGTYAQRFKNKTIFRKKLPRQPDGYLRPIKLNIKVRGPNRVGDLKLGLLQVYACYVEPNATLPDTGSLDTNNSLNRYDLFNNTNTVGGVFFVPTDNTVQQMNYDIDSIIQSTSGFESTATKLTYSTVPDPLGGPDNIVGSAETRTIHSVYSPMAGFFPSIPITVGATFDDLVIQATIFSRDRVHVGTTFSKGSGMLYTGALWYDTTVNQLKIFTSDFEFVQYKINDVIVPTYYSATEAGATIPTYVAGKYILFGDKDYYKKGESGTYVTKYNYLDDSFDLITFETSMSFITE